MEAPKFKVTLGGEEFELQYAFLAFHELGISPFKPSQFMEFMGGEHGENLNAENAAKWIRAGMAWAYVEDGPREGQRRKSLEWIMSRLDLRTFMETFNLSLKAAELKPSEGEAKEPADPPTA